METGASAGESLPKKFWLAVSQQPQQIGIDPRGLFGWARRAAEHGGGQAGEREALGVGGAGIGEGDRPHGAGV